MSKHINWGKKACEVQNKSDKNSDKDTVLQKTNFHLQIIPSFLHQRQDGINLKQNQTQTYNF